MLRARYTDGFAAERGRPPNLVALAKRTILSVPLLCLARLLLADACGFAGRAQLAESMRTRILVHEFMSRMRYLSLYRCFGSYVPTIPGGAYTRDVNVNSIEGISCETWSSFHVHVNRRS